VQHHRRFLPHPLPGAQRQQAQQQTFTVASVLPLLPLPSYGAAFGNDAIFS
jgi:hypothetical protein